GGRSGGELVEKQDRRSFGIVGQIFGPVLAGVISDLNGDATAGLTVGAAILFVGAMLGAVQRPLAQAAR
ncbi:MAG: hypothetical protein AAFW98_06285, partial [Pseudomonadota bacterium]